MWRWKVILVSVDRVNVTISWETFLWTVDEVTQLLPNQKSQRDCRQEQTCTQQVVRRVELSFFCLSQLGILIKIL